MPPLAGEAKSGETGSNRSRRGRGRTEVTCAVDARYTGRLARPARALPSSRGARSGDDRRSITFPSSARGRSPMANTYVVRYGQMRYLGEFTGLSDHEHLRGQGVVVRS